jgi:hypothetical protein
MSCTSKSGNRRSWTAVGQLVVVLALLISAVACHGAGSSPAAANGSHTSAAGAGGVTPPVTQAPAPRAAPPEGDADAETSPKRDLSIDERRGGHTLSRHVGRTDAELSERLRRERDISAASTYPDRATAERVVGRALATSRDRVASWSHRSGSRPNLVLHYASGKAAPTGRVLTRRGGEPRPADGALVVLRWDERGRNWFVLTSYPEMAR